MPGTCSISSAPVGSQAATSSSLQTWLCHLFPIFCPGHCCWGWCCRTCGLHCGVAGHLTRRPVAVTRCLFWGCRVRRPPAVSSAAKLVLEDRLASGGCRVCVSIIPLGGRISWRPPRGSVSRPLRPDPGTAAPLHSHPPISRGRAASGKVPAVSQHLLEVGTNPGLELGAGCCGRGSPTPARVLANGGSHWGGRTG